MKTQGALFALTLLAALGCGLVAGIFYAFSSFVMEALARIPAQAGILAMQSINLAVMTPSFLVVFLGTAAASIVLAIAALLSWETPGAPCLGLGGTLYAIGVVGVTAAFNIPRNEALAAAEPSSAEAAALWARYLSSWTAWNHVRAAASLAAMASFILALCAMAG